MLDWFIWTELFLLADVDTVECCTKGHIGYDRPSLWKCILCGYDTCWPSKWFIEDMARKDSLSGAFQERLVCYAKVKIWTVVWIFKCYGQSGGGGELRAIPQEESSFFINTRPKNHSLMIISAKFWRWATPIITSKFYIFGNINNNIKIKWTF